jgi:hypothetical protein
MPTGQVRAVLMRWSGWGLRGNELPYPAARDCSMRSVIR